MTTPNTEDEDGHSSNQPLLSLPDSSPSAIPAPTPLRTPTQNHVRFQLDNSPAPSPPPAYSPNPALTPRSSSDSGSDWSDTDRDRWADEEDYLSRHARARGAGLGHGQAAPLLTGIEAPSVTVASAGGRDGDVIAMMGGEDGDVEREFGGVKRSGFGSAFVNMANSIIAFGGMVAFCVIVGDTIPHVMVAAFPKLKDLPVLWLLTDRRACIMIFILGISYPLCLYRDVAK
ncbi:MAG: hypothetical protein M4579_007489, partial [Chaenotheca gracillima]